jgi:glycosyltransferase involved in cell wall biosynthesis
VSAGPRVLITVGADAESDARSGPRRDYSVVASALSADVLDRRSVERSWTARLVRSVLGLPAAQAWLAFTSRGRYDAIITDGEHVGIPLAILLRLTRSRVRHATIGHRLSSAKKRPFFTVLGAHRRIDRIAVHSRLQYDHAIASLGIAAEQLELMPYQVDTEFWRPLDVREERLVVSAGLEHRDYPTLFAAVTGMDTQVVIGAASHWSRHEATRVAAPANVRTGSFGYAELRDLYARASVVVVPLIDIDNQAGVTTLLEAMAMGKAVIVTQSAGQTDVVEDRRTSARAGLRPRPESLLRLVAGREGRVVEPNGFYVAPGDAAGLRRAITYLLDNPTERARLGRAGRRMVEELFTVERFAGRVGAMVTDALRSAPMALRVADGGRG